MFKHYILTRYNMGLFTNNLYKIEDKGLYMDSRLPWFKKHLKSLDNQTNQNFTHVVSIDPNTPEEYLRPILNAVYFAKTNSVFIYEKHIDYLKRQQKEEWLITSRLDNDDEYYPEFVETIQKNFKKERMVYDILTEKNGVTSGRGKNNSPFTTLFEPWTEGFKTIFSGGGHTELPKYYKCLRLPYGKALGKINIHGTNAYYK